MTPTLAGHEAPVVHAAFVVGQRIRARKRDRRRRVFCTAVPRVRNRGRHAFVKRINGLSRPGGSIYSVTRMTLSSTATNCVAPS